MKNETKKMITWVIPLIVALIFTAIVFEFITFFKLNFEYILLFILFFMWTELNIRIGESSNDV